MVSSITHLTSTQQLSQILSESKGKLSVSTFCKPYIGTLYSYPPVGHRFSRDMASLRFFRAAHGANPLEFSFSRCGPCHAIAPVFEKLSKQYENVNFLKCDVDAAQEIAREYSVSAM